MLKRYGTKRKENDTEDGTFNRYQINSARSAALKAANGVSIEKLTALTDGSYNHGNSAYNLWDLETDQKKSKRKLGPPKNGDDALQKATDRGAVLGYEEMVDLTPSEVSDGHIEGQSISVDADLASLGSLTNVTGTSFSSKKRKRKVQVFPRSSIVKLKIKKIRSIGGSRSSSSSKLRKKSFKLKKGADAKSMNGISNDIDDAATVKTKTKAATENAWMCGLCGLAFATEQLAEIHEYKCVRAAFYRSPQEDDDEEEEKKEESPIDNEPITTSAAAAFFYSATDIAFSKVLSGGVVPPPHDSLEPILEEGGTPKARNLTRGNTNNVMDIPPPMKKNESTGLGNKSDNDSNPPGGSKLLAKKIPGLIDLSNSMRELILMTDDALIKVAKRADKYVVNGLENDAERELGLLSRDRLYYAVLITRAKERQLGRINSHSTDKTLLGNVRNKFAEAYELVKETDGSLSKDGKTKKSKAAGDVREDIDHDAATLYINVVINNSTRVVDHEVKRLAYKRWESIERNAALDPDKKKGLSDFEKFRVKAQNRFLQLASLALSTDFTPKRVAVQLSNDLVWLLGPQLELRGVSIETQIEYRVGAYFVLGINVKSINWINLIEHSHKEVIDRNQRNAAEELEKNEKLISQKQRKSLVLPNKDSDAEEEEKEIKAMDKMKGRIHDIIQTAKSTTVSDVVAVVLAQMYYLNWIFVIPICAIAYRCGLRSIVDRYILNSVTNDIFQYVEKKGMEMNLRIVDSIDQASFMLNALRELRAGDRKLKKKQEEGDDGEKEEELLGPLLGPAIKEDSGPAEAPPDFVPPENLDHVGLEVDIPVGFRRLRWAFLNSQAEFMLKAVFEHRLGYLENVCGDWSNHNEHVGLPNTPDDINIDDFVGLEREGSYLMPKSAFVKANTAHETAMIEEYNDHCFAIKHKTLTPDVPYGNTFIAWTKIVVTNLGSNASHMVCSVEPEFPKGSPLVAGQIKGGMRSGTADKFLAISETIIKYAESFP